MTSPDLAPRPIRPPRRDGLYMRCVWCDGENYLPAVHAYSAGEIPCAAAGGCGRHLPADYIRRTPKDGPR